jgi:ankyrin repeat protein
MAQNDDHLLEIAENLSKLLANNQKIAWSKLHSAVAKNDKAMVESLLKTPVDTKEKNFCNQTAYEMAQERGYKDIATILENPPAVQIEEEKVPIKNDLPDPISVDDYTKLTDNEITGLIKPGYQDKLDKSGRTLLYFLLETKRLDAVNKLVSLGVDINIKNGLNKETALHYVVAKGYVWLAELLIYSEAKINAQDAKGDTPLHNAALGRHIDMINLLLAHNSNIKIKNYDGFTPSELAKKYGNYKIISLLQQGPDMQVFVDQIKTTVIEGNSEVVSALAPVLPHAYPLGSKINNPVTKGELTSRISM